MSFNVTNDAQWVALIQQGTAALHRGNAALARDLFEQAVRVNPASPDSHGWLGEAYRLSREYEKAIASYERAIALAPERFEARINRGEVLRLQGRIAEAMEAWQFVVNQGTALARPPVAGAAAGPNATFVSFAYNNLGIACHDQGDMDQALRYHQLATQWDPANGNAWKSYVFTYGCGAEADPARTLDLARQRWTHHRGGITPMIHQRPGKGFRALRIGFVSSDLRNHSVAYFLLGLFTKFDRARHQFYCYANVGAPDSFTAQFRELATAWRNIVGAADEAVAQMIAFDKIDILIDLGGFTGGSRVEVFAYRAAPIQVAYLGCPITTGCPQIDWRITDALADPPGLTEAHFSERLWRLDRPAWCYRPMAAMAGEETPPVLRGKPFTFGSFNNLLKVTPAAIGVWAGILRTVPGSRLMLKGTILADGQFSDKLRGCFAERGVSPDRLLLYPRHADAGEHLASYDAIDLALDSFPYNGTTTTCEALWMGVPVLTLSGYTHCGRVGHSLLSAVGLPELSAASPEQYQATAVRLATDAAALAALRQGLRRRLEGSPLMDEARFADAFCAALRGMWRQWCAPKRR